MRQIFDQIKRLKTIASEFFPPHLAGSGLMMRELTDSSARVALPLIWTNHARGRRELSVGVLLSAAEFAVQAVFDRHFPQVAHRVTFREWAWQGHALLDRTVELRYSWPNADREAFLSETFRGGESIVQGEVLGFFEDDRLACTLSFQAHVRTQQALPNGRGLSTE